MDDCDKDVQTGCKNDHSTSKVLGHSDQTINNNLILTSDSMHSYCIFIKHSTGAIYKQDVLRLRYTEMGMVSGPDGPTDSGHVH